MNIKKDGTLNITKVDMENRMVFGFFNVNKIGDDLVQDLQKDIIETEELEKAAYNFVLDARVAGDSHVRKGVGSLVESMMFTYEKQEAIVETLKKMGVEEPVFNLGIEGWWGGFKITDEEVMAKIDEGKYPMFSIGGRSSDRVDLEE